MTGRDLIIYILSNGLEDKPIFENGKVLGFMNEVEAASKFGVGLATIKVWCDCDVIDHVTIGNRTYIPVNATFHKTKTI